MADKRVIVPKYIRRSINYPGTLRRTNISVHLESQNTSGTLTGGKYPANF